MTRIGDHLGSIAIEWIASILIDPLPIELFIKQRDDPALFAVEGDAVAMILDHRIFADRGGGVSIEQSVTRDDDISKARNSGRRQEEIGVGCAILVLPSCCRVAADTARRGRVV